MKSKLTPERKHEIVKRLHQLKAQSDAYLGMVQFADSKMNEISKEAEEIRKELGL